MGYLVISRRVSERIQIGEDIEILISDISIIDGAPKVDIAINAPKKYNIKRRVTHLEEQDYGAKLRNKPG